LLTFCHSTSYVLLPLLRVFLGAASVVAHLEVYALPFVAAEPEVVFVAVRPDVYALLFAAAELSPEVVVLAAEPAVVSVVASVADVAEPQASFDIPVAFDVLVPVSVVPVEVDSSGRPKSLAFPNVDHFATPASSVEVAGNQFAHNTSGARTNHGFCNALSIPDLHQNKILEHYGNKPSRGHSNVIDTNDLAMGATTSHSRKTSLSLRQEQRKHSTYQATLSLPEVPEI
jgi:hypothetical protein